MSGKDKSLVEIPIRETDRGGFALRLVMVRDHQLVSQDVSIYVPWDNKELGVQFSTFRDKLRPGGRETWRVTVKRPGGGEVGAKAAEILAYMYDRSLDAFAPHNPPSPLSLWPYRAASDSLTANLAAGSARWLYYEHDIGSPPTLTEDRLQFLDSYGIGGPGSGRRFMRGDDDAIGECARDVGGGACRAPGSAGQKGGHGSRWRQHRREGLPAGQGKKRGRGGQAGFGRSHPASRELLRDRLLEAAAPDRAGRLCHHRVRGARFRHLLEGLGARGHDRPAGRLDEQGGANGQGPYGPSVHVTFPPRR